MSTVRHYPGSPLTVTIGNMSEQDIRRQIASRVRTLRDAKRWSQQQLADEASISRSYVAQIESINPKQPKAPSLPVLTRVAVALGVALEELVGDDATMRHLREIQTDSIPGDGDSLVMDLRSRIEAIHQDLREVKEEMQAVRTRFVPVSVVDDSFAVAVIGRVPADGVRWAAMTEEWSVEVPRERLRNTADPIGLEVTGDCFRSLGIWSGDVVICDRVEGRRPHDRDLVVVRIGDGISLKRWCIAEDTVELRDGNEQVVHRITNGDDVEVLAFFVTYVPIAPR